MRKGKIWRNPRPWEFQPGFYGELAQLWIAPDTAGNRAMAFIIPLHDLALFCITVCHGASTAYGARGKMTYAGPHSVDAQRTILLLVWSPGVLFSAIDIDRVDCRAREEFFDVFREPDVQVVFSLPPVESEPGRILDAEDCVGDRLGD